MNETYTPLRFLTRVGEVISSSGDVAITPKSNMIEVQCSDPAKVLTLNNRQYNQSCLLYLSLSQTDSGYGVYVHVVKELCFSKLSKKGQYLAGGSILTATNNTSMTYDPDRRIQVISSPTLTIPELSPQTLSDTLFAVSREFNVASTNLRTQFYKLESLVS